MVSLLPAESEARLRERFGERFNQLTPLEVQTLVTAEVEGMVSNPRMRVICDQHPADLTKMLQGLVGKGYLTRDGQGRWTTYRLATIPQIGPDSSHNGGSIPHNGGSIPHNEDELPPEAVAVLQSLPPQDRAQLLTLAGSAAEKKRRSPEETRQIIQQACRGRFLTAVQIAALIGRDRDKTLERFLTPMVDGEILEMQHPREPKHPSQAYTTKTK